MHTLELSYASLDPTVLDPLTKAWGSKIILSKIVSLNLENNEKLGDIGMAKLADAWERGNGGLMIKTLKLSCCGFGPAGNCILTYIVT